MKKDFHLCYTCKNAQITKADVGDTTYISYECKYKDIEHHAIVVRLPQTNHVISCPKYEKASLWERLKRKWLWRFG